MQNLIVSGGNDKDAVVYNRKTAQVGTPIIT